MKIKMPTLLRIWLFGALGALSLLCVLIVNLGLGRLEARLGAWRGR